MAEAGGRLSGSAGALLEELPPWATLVRAPNPGPMTLTGTNSWVLRGPSGLLVVDPGPIDEGHLATLASHGNITGVLLTHGHHDHVEGVDRLIELTGAPLLDPLDQETLTSRSGLEVTVLPTPGHTSDSVCFIINDQAVLTGDTILGTGSTIVAFPDGDLASYLASLKRLAALGSIPALPGHGPALADVSQAATFYLAHREARLEQVAAALAAGAHTPAEVVEIVYADTDPALWWAAELTVRAQVQYLTGGRP